MPSEFKYLAIYNYYKERIASGQIAGGEKLPSVRVCAAEQAVSRTTVQTAYDFLCADGYITARPQSGYYANSAKIADPQDHAVRIQAAESFRYDLASERADSDSFDFRLWQRYIKSALRQSERLLSYGDPQGEYDLRRSVCDYLRARRGAVCSPDSIVIGAGSQSLLSLILPLIHERRTVYFTNSAYTQGQTIFSDAGFSVIDRDDAQICYITPSRLTRKGDVMRSTDRFAFARRAAQTGQLIIEDDYGSELSDSGRSAPCIQGICGGDAVYISTFSKLLIPSIRIGFMILPPALLEKYRAKSELYNQTASKIEQIAMSKFIQDGHLNSQIRKIRRAYAEKSPRVCSLAESILGECAAVYPEDSGRYLRLRIRCALTARQIAEEARRRGLLLQPISGSGDSFILSYYGVGEEELATSFCLLKSIVSAAESLSAKPNVRRKP